MIIDKQLLDKVSEQAKQSPRLRMNYNFHLSLDEKCHRFLNAVEPGTRVEIHRHPAKDETFVLLRGKIKWIFYDNEGKETESVILDANGEQRMLNVERDRWHSLVCLESGSVLYESKDGPYHPLAPDEILEVKS